MFWLLLNSARTLPTRSLFPTLPPASKLWVGKKLWECRAWTADSNWTEEYSTSYIMLRNKNLRQRKKTLGTLAFHVAIAQRLAGHRSCGRWRATSLHHIWVFCSFLHLLNCCYPNPQAALLLFFLFSPPSPCTSYGYAMPSDFCLDNYFNSLKRPTLATTVQYHGSQEQLESLSGHSQQ